MEPMIVWTDASMEEQGATSTFEMDMGCSDSHDGQNDFECKLPMNIRLEPDSALYVDGTGYGGLVQERESDTTIEGVLGWRGRTWEGVMFDRVLEPPSGSAYRTYSGAIDDGIDDLMANLGLDGLFCAGQCPSESVSVTYTRYPRGWTALRELLGAAGLRPSLRCVSDGGTLKVLVDAEEPKTLGEEVDGETSDMAMVRVFTAYNHLIALGKGEGTEREIYECYADVDGNVSTVQTITGLAERVYLYDYPNAESEELEENAIKTLQEMQGQGEVSVALAQGADVHIGDFATAYDPRIDESVTAMVTGCVVKVTDGASTVEWRAE